MTRHDPATSMRDMLLYAPKAVRFMEGKTRTELDKDEILGLATTRVVESIGEAASRIPPNVREQHPQLPWKEIIGTRQRLAHGYDAVDLRVLWDILSLDLPPLIEQLRAIVE